MTARLDRVLRIEGDGLVPPEVAAQAIEVMQAASDVQRAAVASASDANGQRVKTLVRDAERGDPVRGCRSGLGPGRVSPRRR